MNNKSFLDNGILRTDSYKLAHWRMQTKGLETMHSYFESRGGEFNKIVFFGLQYFLKQYLVGKFVTMDKINEAEEVCALHLGSKDHFNRAAWEHILYRHGGQLPLRICAVPEGSLVNTLVPLITVENLCKECAFLTSYVETILVEVWGACTVATYSHDIKKMIRAPMLETCDTLDKLPFMLHDFGFRGVDCPESAALMGAAHLLNFRGTDTIAALMLHRNFYGEKMAGFSIPASEHSIMCQYGKEYEADAVGAILDAFPTGPVAIVGDTWNIFDFCDRIIGTIHKDRILARDGVVIVRPDSGPPAETDLACAHILGHHFGQIINKKGYKVLNPKVALIQGDGVNEESIKDILDAQRRYVFAADTINYGSGGALLQDHNRDRCKFAFKASEAIVYRQARGISKCPITDKGKQSKEGRFSVIRCGNEYRTLDQQKSGITSATDDLLKPVFLHGELTSDQTLKEIRERLDNEPWT